MKICLFGTYNNNYSRNSCIRDGLKQLGVDVTEAHVSIPTERLELPEDFSLQKSWKRMWKKIETSFLLLKKYQQVFSSDIVLVLHPGHLDLPIAWLLCLLGKKKLFFDTSISPYDTMIVGRNMAKINSPKEKILKFAEAMLLRLPYKLFTDTKLMKRFIVSNFGINEKKIFVTPLGANNAIYKPKKIKRRNEKTEILFFGMYNPLHGALYILQAIRLLKNYKNLYFTLVGDGPLKKELIEYAKKHQLTNVFFKGFMPENKLVDYIQRSDILLGVFSNNKIIRRVIPNKVFGALACQKPLITARQPVMQEFFKHEKNIYFCKPEDSKSLALAVIHLSSDKDLQNNLAKNGYLLYIKNFTPKKIGNTLIKGITSG